MACTVLVFGEDDTDRMAIARLLPALLIDQVNCNIRPLKRPLILSRNAELRKKKAVSSAIADFCRAYEKLGKTYAVVHRDCDAVEPAHVEEADLLEAGLRAAGVKNPIAATPAWEIEAWWMLFPEALAAICPSWERVNYGKQNVGRVENAKERLVSDLRPRDPKKRNRVADFSSQDAVRLAKLVAENPSHIDNITAVSDSFFAFCEKIRRISE